LITWSILAHGIGGTSKHHRATLKERRLQRATFGSPLFPRRSAGTFYATSKIALIARASPPFDRHRRPHDGQQTPISKARWLCYGQRTSIDYIPMNSPFLGRKDWEAEVTKMIKVMGAPIKPEEVPHIVDYLSRHYGK
jgi:hypothetical protein